MKLFHATLLSLVGVLFLSLGCGNTYYPYVSYPILPANYATIYNEWNTSADYLIFVGAYNPTGTQNGTGSNLLYLHTFAQPALATPSTLVGSTWVGRMGDITSPQLTLTFASEGQLNITLDCYFSSTNILAGSPAVTLPVLLRDKTVYFRHVFRIVNTSTTDIYTFCAFTANTNSLSFSTDMGTAILTTGGGTVLGTFTRQ